MMRVLLAGAGTAGHVNPMLATAEILSERGHEVYILGTKNGIENTLVNTDKYTMFRIDKLVFPRSNPFQILTLPSKLSALVKQVAAIIRAKDIDVVCGFGGYVSAPAYLAAKKLGVPVVVHEQNAKAGMANKLGARYAKAVALTFNTDLKARKGTTVVTGMPLRKDIVELAGTLKVNPAQMAEQAYEYFGLDPKRKTVLVTGGSLGALSINTAFVNFFENSNALPEDIQVLHLTGKDKDEAIRQAVLKAGESDKYKIYQYLQDMHYAYAIADAVICRCGASTVAEISALSIPAFYIPLPIGNGEQSLNALDSVKAGSAKLIQDADFSHEKILEILHGFSDGTVENMRIKAVENTECNGGEKLADIIENLQGSRR